MPMAYVITQPMQKASQPSAAHRNPYTYLFASAAGGSAGIGKATALAFDKNGCKVAVLGRRKERLDAVVSISFPRSNLQRSNWTFSCAGGDHFSKFVSLVPTFLPDRTHSRVCLLDCLHSALLAISAAAALSLALYVQAVSAMLCR